MRYLVLALGFILGFAAREAIGDAFRLFYRGQAALLGAPLALLAGWSFVWRPTSLLALICLLAAELMTIAFALRLVRRGNLSPVTAVASTSNSGFWSTPIAAVMFGPAGAAFAIVYDIVGAIRPFIIVRTLRRRAPEPPSRRSALADYLPAAALILGLALQLARPIPTRAEDVIPWLALVLGAVVFSPWVPRCHTAGRTRTSSLRPLRSSHCDSRSRF